MNIGFVTCDAAKLAYYFPTRAEPDFISTEPPFTPDDQIAVNALRKMDCNVRAVQWGVPVSSLANLDLIVVRSPWDYMDSPDNVAAFFAWIEAIENTGLVVANPSRFMRWMLDKKYLNDIALQGISVIPTEYLDLNAEIDLQNLFLEKGPFILKPCISAAGIGLYFIESISAAQRLQSELRQHLRERKYMLQAFIPEIVTKGEWSLIFIAGEYSHAIHKAPAPNEIMVHAERGGSLHMNVEPPASIITFAKQVYMAALRAYASLYDDVMDRSRVLYLRVDIIESANGPVLLECEGVEPELFFRARPHSAEEFASTIKIFYRNAK